MIFLTVGTQLPFDRLTRAVDEWAGRSGRRDIFGQVGPSEYKPKHMEFRDFIAPQEFASRFAEAELVIAHAGMGTILSAMNQAKPLLVMPRRASLGEQRNDHQLATARRFSETKGVIVAMDEAELKVRLDQLRSLPAASRIGPYASPELLAAISRIIADNEPTDA